MVAQVFTAHDDLDGALVGAEDALAALADRFDLDDERAAELEGLLVDYATHVAVELRRGSARASRALEFAHRRLRRSSPRSTVEDSSARELIARGALTASKGAGSRTGLAWLRGVTRSVAVRSASRYGWYARSRACTRTCVGCTPQPALPRPAPGRSLWRRRAP